MNTTFIQDILTISNQPLNLCFHCHKCTAGCPVAYEMEYGPDRVLRLIQLGERERLLSSHDIWLCAACEACGARCPNGIDISRVMDALRAEALKAGIVPAEPDAVKFHRLFLWVVQNLGRMHEASLLIAYKLWTMNLMADMDSGVQMMIKGKVPVIPKAVKNRNQVRKLFVHRENPDAPTRSEQPGKEAK